MSTKGKNMRKCKEIRNLFGKRLCPGDCDRQPSEEPCERWTAVLQKGRTLAETIVQPTHAQQVRRTSFPVCKLDGDGLAFGCYRIGIGSNMVPHARWK